MIDNLLLSDGVFRCRDGTHCKGLFITESGDQPGIDPARLKSPHNFSVQGQFGAAGAEPFRFQG